MSLWKRLNSNTDTNRIQLSQQNLLRSSQTPVCVSVSPLHPPECHHGQEDLVGDLTKAPLQVALQDIGSTWPLEQLAATASTSTTSLGPLTITIEAQTLQRTL